MFPTHIFEKLLDPLVPALFVGRDNIGDEQCPLAERFVVVRVDGGKPHFHKNLVNKFLQQNGSN